MSFQIKWLNYTRLALKLAYMIRTYRKCDPTVGFLKYGFKNKLMFGVTFFRVTSSVTLTQSYKYIGLRM